jgi:hypothetical protein
VPNEAAQFLDVALKVSGQKQLTLDSLKEVIGDEKQLQELRGQLKKLGKGKKRKKIRFIQHLRKIKNHRLKQHQQHIPQIDKSFILSYF